MLKRLIKDLYRLVPFKKELYSLLKLVYAPPQSLYRHLHFKGVFVAKLPGNRKFRMRHYGYEIENELFWSGIGKGWEKESLGLWQKLCPGAKVILDIGANTGIYSLVAQAINPSASVHAFEPLKVVHRKLVSNASLNQFPIHCHCAAISNYNGTAKVFLPSEEHVYSVTVNKNLNPSTTSVVEQEIQTLTLRSFIEENKIGRIDLIKLDVETHEAEALEGMGDYLQAMKPTLLIEVLNDEIGDRIGQLTKGCDYLYYNINEKGPVKKVDAITKSDTYNYLFCSRETAARLNLPLE